MTSKDTDSRKQNSKTDAFIQDYLSDIWGDAFAPNKEHLIEESPTPIKEAAAVVQNIVQNVVQKVEQTTLQKIAVEAKIPNNSSILLIKSTERIQKKFSLIPTIKINFNSNEQALRTRTESLIILLTNLYFLRRSLSPKVRQYILNLSEQVIDDFNAAYWLQGVALKEVCHEV